MPKHYRCHACGAVVDWHLTQCPRCGASFRTRYVEAKVAGHRAEDVAKVAREILSSSKTKNRKLDIFGFLEVKLAP